jgi:Asp-tRNA(Asn)/Glu-tRNA(Gln) amidotransferase A subunit family amidase
MACTALFNLTGHPVATVPLRCRPGLLPELQIVGRRDHDNEVVDLAIEIEKAGVAGWDLQLPVSLNQ